MHELQIYNPVVPHPALNSNSAWFPITRNKLQLLIPKLEIAKPYAALGGFPPLTMQPQTIDVPFTVASGTGKVMIWQQQPLMQELNRNVCTTTYPLSEAQLRSLSTSPLQL